MQNANLSIGLPYFMVVGEYIQESYGHSRFHICISHLGETSICNVPQWFILLNS